MFHQLATAAWAFFRMGPYEVQTEVRFRRKLDLWITFRRTLPACARK
jgi:hypothetical protein